MKEEELLYALALQRVKGIGDIIAKKLIEVCGSPKSVLQERQKTLGKINGNGTV
jgi:DNA processing protein